MTKTTEGKQATHKLETENKMAIRACEEPLDGEVCLVDLLISWKNYVQKELLT